MISTRLLFAAVAAAIVTLTLTGCGNTSSPSAGGTSQAASTTGPDAGPADSYLATGQGWVNYLQWDSTGTGTLTDDALSGTAPQEQVTSSQTPIAVTANGSSLDISGLSAAKFGTLSGGTLTLQVLQSSGQLGTATFAAAGQNAFNAAVQALQQQAQSDNDAALQQQAQASSASANAAAQQQAGHDLAAVQGISLSSDLSQLASDVKQTDGDLAAEKTAAGAGQDGPGGPQCYNLTSVVDYDAENDVEYDAQNTFGYDLQNKLQTDISSGRSAISALQGDLSSLQSMGLATPSGAQAAISAARSAISHAVLTANADIQKVNSDVSQAYSLANNMATGNCAGDGPSSPSSPIQPIS